MMKTSELKSEARALMIGKYGFFATFILIYYVSSLIATAIPSAIFPGIDLPAVNMVLRFVLSFLLLVIVNLIKVGIARAAFGTVFEKETSLRDIFYAFGNDRDAFLKIEMLLSAIQSGISLLLVFFEHLNEVYSFDVWEYYGLYIVFSALILVLNLAVTLRLTFAVYVIMDQPGIGALPALRASLILTKRKYFRYLFFRLSFAGMYILGYLSMLIGFLYVLPYIETSVCLYYKGLSRQVC